MSINQYNPKNDKVIQRILLGAAAFFGLITVLIWISLTFGD